MTPLESLRTEKVRAVGPQDVLRVAPTASVRDAIAMMQQARRGCVLVCDEDQLLGIFTERDLLRRVINTHESLSAPIERFMTREPVTIGLENTIAEAIRRMHRGGYRRLPVVDPSGRPIGIVSVRGVVHYLVQHFPAAVYNLPERKQVHDAREGA